MNTTGPVWHATNPCLVVYISGAKRVLRDATAKTTSNVARRQAIVPMDAWKGHTVSHVQKASVQVGGMVATVTSSVTVNRGYIALVLMECAFQTNA